MITIATCFARLSFELLTALTAARFDTEAARGDAARTAFLSMVVIDVMQRRVMGYSAAVALMFLGRRLSAKPHGHVERGPEALTLICLRW